MMLNSSLEDTLACTPPQAEDGVADPSKDGSDGDEPPDMGNAVADVRRAPRLDYEMMKLSMLQ